MNLYFLNYYTDNLSQKCNKHNDLSTKSNMLFPKKLRRRYNILHDTIFRKLILFEYIILIRHIINCAHWDAIQKKAIIKNTTSSPMMFG